MNVMFTTYCNQNCCYCFGQDAMESQPAASLNPDAREISAENLQFALDFLRRSQMPIISIIGGEPTLHSQFTHRYEQVAKSGFEAIIFSNGVMKTEQAVFLSRQKTLQDVLLNIRQPEEYSAADWQKIRATLKHIKRVTLSFRIYRLNFDLNFLFDLIDEFGLKRKINFAPALPSLHIKNTYLPLEQYRDMAAELVKWSGVSKKRKISWYSDNGFILCGFSRSDLSTLRKNTGFVPNINCRAAVEVKPDLSVQRCFGIWSKTNESPVNLRKFSSLVKLHNYFDLLSSIVKQRYGARQECRRCLHLRSGICGGGCLIHIFKNHPALAQARIFTRGQ